MVNPVENQDRPIKKMRLAREHPLGIIIPRWWRNRLAVGIATVAVASVVLALNAMQDAKDRVTPREPDAPVVATTEPTPDAWYKNQPKPPVDLISGPDKPLFPEFRDDTNDAAPRAYEEALPSDLIEHAPVIYPDATGPRVVVPEEYIPEPFVIGAPNVVNDAVPVQGSSSEVTSTPTESTMPTRQSAPVQSIEPALEEVLVAISTSQLGTLDNPDNKDALWQQNAIEFDLLAAAGRPMIAIVIDDMGVDPRRSKTAVELPGPLTLSYLTYAKNLPEQTLAAAKNGHELMLHVPMQPESDTVDPGPEVLRPQDGAEEILRRLRWGMSQFDGYVGINNHMGSRFTRDLSGMRVVLAEIKSRGLLFLDSRTSGGSVATTASHEFDVPFATRNIFLDHVDDEQEIRERLSETERLARKNGSAIAIGHPRDATLAVISEWLMTLEEKDIVLAPISAIVRHNWKPIPSDEIATFDQ